MEPRNMHEINLVWTNKKGGLIVWVAIRASSGLGIINVLFSLSWLYNNSHDS